VPVDGVGDRSDDFGIGEHAELHRGDVEILETGIDLRMQECDRRHVHGHHAASVLRRERGNRRQPVHAVCGEGPEVGLDAGAAAGIGTGDGQGGDDALVVHAGHCARD
jgi:hypothetical protein